MHLVAGLQAAEEAEKVKEAERKQLTAQAPVQLLAHLKKVSHPSLLIGKRVKLRLLNLGLDRLCLRSSMRKYNYGVMPHAGYCSIPLVCW